jgi:hypothetical protein
MDGLGYNRDFVPDVGPTACGIEEESLQLDTLSASEAVGRIERRS